MMRRSVRILVLLLTVAVTAGVVWRATMNEQIRGRMRLAAQQADVLAADAIFEFIDLRSTLHAYVAPGQGEAFWAGARAGPAGAACAAACATSRPPRTAADHPLTRRWPVSTGSPRPKARRAPRSGTRQLLVAGDIIFTEARDLIDCRGRAICPTRARRWHAQPPRVRRAWPTNSRCWPAR